MINLPKITGKFKILYVRSEDNKPNNVPNNILKNQLVKAIKKVSYNLFNSEIKISPFNSGEIDANMNSETKLIPPKCKFVDKFIEIGIMTNIGRKDKIVEFIFSLFNYLIDLI